MKKVVPVIILLSFMLVFTVTSPVSAAESSTQMTAIPETDVIDTVIDTIGKNIQFDAANEEFIVEDVAKISNDISDEDLQKINELAKQQNVNVVYTKESLVEKFTEGIDELNESISNNELTVLTNGELIEKNDENFYVQGGSTKAVNHWWGTDYYKSTANANKWAYEANQLAIGHVVAGGAIGFFSGGLGFVVGGVASSWYFMFANSLNYYNGLSKRGIVASITKAFVYNVKTQ
ncbi:hypothetical protein ACQKMD_15310 [Viridibacillus sp. NPDC096237]|uniref:hypothetical protein n=1 Tax=Viridibacillus sp. NPDC096237 TaxID=3390721 RepID=UPI003D021471